MTCYVPASCNGIYKSHTMKDILEKAAGIRLLIFDVDGVLTDGSLFIGDDGQE